MSKKLATKQLKIAKRAIGRPKLVARDLEDRICSAIANGGNLDQICGKNGLPSQPTVRKWLSEDPEFFNDYARAREARADARADRIDKIVKNMLAGKVRPDAARVAIDAEKWQAGKEQPKRYGNRPQPEDPNDLRNLSDDELKRKIDNMHASLGFILIPAKSPLPSDE